MTIAVMITKTITMRRTKMTIQLILTLIKTAMAMIKTSTLIKNANIEIDIKIGVIEIKIITIPY